MPTRSRPIREAAAAKSDFERTELTKEKTGVQLGGVKGINPVNGKGDPHLHFGLCPLHLRNWCDHGRPGPLTTSDWEFAKKFGCEIIEVVKGRQRAGGGLYGLRHRRDGQFRLP